MLCMWLTVWDFEKMSLLYSQGGIKQDAAVLIAQCRQTEWQYWETKNELWLLSSWLTNHNGWEDIDELLTERKVSFLGKDRK